MFRATKRVEKAHSADIWFSNWNNSNIITGSLDGTVKIWDNNLECKKTTVAQKLGMTSAHITNDENQLITCGQDSVIRFYDLNGTESNMTEVSNINPGLMEAWTIACSSDDRLIISGSSTGKLHMWSLDSKSEISTIDVNSKFILQSKFTQDNTTIATAGMDGILNVVDVATAKVIHRIAAHALPIRSISFSNDLSGKLIFTASDDRHVSIFDTTSGRVINSFSHLGSVLSVDALSTNRRHFITSTSTNQVTVWDMGLQQPVQVLDAQHTEPVWSVSYRHNALDSSIAPSFISAGEGGVLQMYESNSKQ